MILRPKGNVNPSVSSTMMVSPYLLLLLVFLLASSSEAEEEPMTCRANNQYQNLNVCILTKQPQCGLYMAPSTLGEGANLGMYAGEDIASDTIIQQEIAIPLAFRSWEGPDYFHHWPELDKSGEKDDGALWYRYMWAGWVANLETYNVHNVQDSKVVFVPGIGCTINSILEMRNVLSTHGSVYDTAGLSRSDPSAGAFCPYHSSDTKSVVDIPAGSEIFADYGDEWIPEIPGAQITFDRVMDRAEDFLRDDYIPFIEQHATQFTPTLLEGLWNFTRDFPHANPETFTVLPRQVTWKEIYDTYQMLHEKEQPILEKLQQLESIGILEDAPQLPFYNETSSIVRHFIRQQGRRTLDWLEDHGRCCDHMRPGTSSIPHAGRGAFATRHLPKGTIVGYSPVVHVGTYGMDLYNIPYSMGKNGTHKYNKMDLIYNYAFGHPNSTILLSPYGSMVNFINHSPNPNVRIVWPAEEMIAHKPDWLDRDIETITHTFEKIGLSFDYVALRDIEEGEEILMDYGREWEQAWDDHVQNWKPPLDAEKHVHSSQWNETKLRTVEEQAENPYPPNLMTTCIPAYIWDRQNEAYVYLPLEKDYVDRVPCQVLERREHLSSELDEELEIYVVQLDFIDRPVRVLHFPRSAIFLTDKIMSQDWHLPNTFRHYIGIPDDIFPPQWKNKPLSLAIENDGEEKEEAA